MKKIIRLTESELVNLVKKVLNEQDDNLVPDDVYGPLKKDNYTQKGAHFLIGKDGKGITLPVGTVWKHISYGPGSGEEPVDYLMEYKYNIVFSCWGVDDLIRETAGPRAKDLQDFKNSGPLIQQLKKERCLDGEWDYSKYSTYNPFR